MYWSFRQVYPMYAQHLLSPEATSLLIITQRLSEMSSKLLTEMWTHLIITVIVFVREIESITLSLETYVKRKTSAFDVIRNTVHQCLRDHFECMILNARTTNFFWFIDSRDSWGEIWWQSCSIYPTIQANDQTPVSLMVALYHIILEFGTYLSNH